MTRLTRRAFLAAAAAAAATASCGPAVKAPTAAATPSPTPLPPPEVSTLTLTAAPACDPWLWLADEQLREEGFTVQRAKPGQSLLKGEVDVGVSYANVAVTTIDAGQPLLVLGGSHVGCLELWAREGIAGLRDLRGKRIPVSSRSPMDLGYSFWTSALTYVGIGVNEVNWVEDPDLFAGTGAETAFIDGKVDVFLAGPLAGIFLKMNPKNPGRKIVDITMDKPWSQNYCCMIVTNRAFAERNPVATKRMTRAIFRTIDLGAKDLAHAARVAVDQKVFGSNPRVTYDTLYEFLKDMPFNWRDYSPEDAVSFFALRLADGKLIKKSPQQIIADGTDFAYARQLRTELKP